MESTNTKLAGLSKEALRELAEKALKLAEDLEREEPSEALALANGVKDGSYNIWDGTRYAYYSGEAVIEMDNGKKWKAIGHGTVGDPYYVYKEGWIEFCPL